MFTFAQEIIHDIFKRFLIRFTRSQFVLLADHPRNLIIHASMDKGTGNISPYHVTSSLEMLRLSGV